MSGVWIGISILISITSVHCLIPFLYRTIDTRDPGGGNSLREALKYVGIDATGVRILNLRRKNEYARTSYKATFTLPGSGMCYLKWRTYIFGWKGRYVPTCEKGLGPLTGVKKPSRNENSPQSSNVYKRDKIVENQPNQSVKQDELSRTTTRRQPQEATTQSIISPDDISTTESYSHKKSTCRYCPPGKPNNCYNFPCLKPNEDRIQHNRSNLNPPSIRSSSQRVRKYSAPETIKYKNESEEEAAWSP